MKAKTSPDEETLAAVRLSMEIGNDTAARKLGMAPNALARLRNACHRDPWYRQLRGAALRLSKILGSTGAARALRLVPTTVSRWRQQEGLQGEIGEWRKREGVKPECVWCGADMPTAGLCGDSCRAEYVAAEGK